MNITLPTSFDVTSRGKSVTVNVATLTDEIITKLVLHGLTQKIADAAASAGSQAKEQLPDGSDEDRTARAADIGKSLMQKVADSLATGNWGVERTGGTAVDPMTVEIRNLLRTAVKAKVGADAWKTLSDDERAKKIDTAFGKLPDAKRDEITKAAKGEIARKAAAKKVAASIEIDL